MGFMSEACGTAFPTVSLNTASMFYKMVGGRHIPCAVSGASNDIRGRVDGFASLHDGGSMSYCTATTTISSARKRGCPVSISGLFV